MIRLTTLLLTALALLAPLTLAEEKFPDASDLLFPTEGTMVVTIKKLGKLKEERNFPFFHGPFDFEIANGGGEGITGFLDTDFTPPRMEADDQSAEDYFAARFQEWADDQENVNVLDSVAMTTSKGKVKVRPAKLTLAITWSLVMSFDLVLTIDGAELITTAKMTLKGKGALPFAVGDTEWDVMVKTRASVPKIGSAKDATDMDIVFNPNNTVEIGDPVAGVLDGNWTVDEKGKVTIVLDTDEFDLVLEDIVTEVQFETFKFLDDAVLELSDIIIKAKVKAGVSITFSMTIKFSASGTVDDAKGNPKPASGTARYTVRGKGCLDS
jgi:hypothetical protein